MVFFFIFNVLGELTFSLTFTPYTVNKLEYLSSYTKAGARVEFSRKEESTGLLRNVDYVLNTMENEDTIQGNEIFFESYTVDDVCTAIYLGEITFIGVLEDRGIEKWKNPSGIQAAILSYRNSLAE